MRQIYLENCEINCTHDKTHNLMPGKDNNQQMISFACKLIRN